MGSDERHDPAGLPRQREALLEIQADLSERHAHLREEGSALVEQREHRDRLIEQREALAAYHRETVVLSPSQRARLELPKAIVETAEMLAETLDVIEQGREAWQRATDVWQRVRERLDK
jgi:hypothetical protein